MSSEILSAPLTFSWTKLFFENKTKQQQQQQNNNNNNNNNNNKNNNNNNKPSGGHVEKKSIKKVSNLVFYAQTTITVL